MFADKVVVITGGSSGLGEALAIRLAKKGAKLALIARDKGRLVATKDKLVADGAGRKIETYVCDVTDHAAVEATFDKIAADFGAIDILINSAGVLREGYFEKHTLDTFREVMNINYFGTLHCIRAALPRVKASKGRIVNICSLGGLLGAFGYAAYCSSKFAVKGLTEVLRAELKPQGVAVHCVCPPEFDSPMVEAIEANGRSIENRVIAQTVPTMNVEDVADAAIRGIEKGEYLIIPGFVSRAMERSNRWAPAFGRFLVDFRIGKIYLGPGGNRNSEG